MQLQYNLEQPESFRGQIVDNRTAEVLTGAAAEEMSFGLPVYVSSWVNAKKPTVSICNATADLDKLFGFVVYQPRERGTYPVSYSGNDNAPAGTVIKANMEVAILRKGALWTDHTIGTIAPGGIGILDSTSASLGKLQTTTAQSGDVTYYGLQFLSGGAVGTLVQLQVNLPSYFVKR